MEEYVIAAIVLVGAIILIATTNTNEKYPMFGFMVLK